MTEATPPPAPQWVRDMIGKYSTELADLQSRFEASQLLADQTLRELARVSEEATVLREERDRALYERDTYAAQVTG